MSLAERTQQSQVGSGASHPAVMPDETIPGHGIHSMCAHGVGNRWMHPSHPVVEIEAVSGRNNGTSPLKRAIRLFLSVDSQLFAPTVLSP